VVPAFETTRIRRNCSFEIKACCRGSITAAETMNWCSWASASFGPLAMIASPPASSAAICMLRATIGCSSTMSMTCPVRSMRPLATHSPMDCTCEPRWTVHPIEPRRDNGRGLQTYDALYVVRPALPQDVREARPVALQLARRRAQLRATELDGQDVVPAGQTRDRSLPSPLRSAWRMRAPLPCLPLVSLRPKLAFNVKPRMPPSPSAYAIARMFGWPSAEPHAKLRIPMPDCMGVRASGRSLPSPTHCKGAD
jgi:hypothetical protein